MAIKDVLRMGHPVLRTPAAEVDTFNSPALDGLVTDMFDTMAACNGAGLAAPQIGVALRVVVFEVNINPRYPDVEPVPRTVLINPAILPLGEEMDEMWEGCLSLPGMKGRVPRHTAIRYSGFDQYGERMEREVTGFHARVVQHEVDHLDGILYPQRIRDLRNFGYEAELFPEGGRDE